MRSKIILRIWCTSHFFNLAYPNIERISWITTFFLLLNTFYNEFLIGSIFDFFFQKRHSFLPPSPPPPLFALISEIPHYPFFFLSLFCRSIVKWTIPIIMFLCFIIIFSIILEKYYDIVQKYYIIIFLYFITVFCYD